MLKINGSFGEGGGQILRTSLALSAITQTPIQIEHIRANRKKPGLQPQHLMCCNAVNQLCRGSLTGAQLVSNFIQFIPREIEGGEYFFDISTAGSVILLAQAIIPICLSAAKVSRIHIVGGTHVNQSPNYDYFANVFLPALRQFGATITSQLTKVGYYPKGGGIIELEIKPSILSGCKHWQKKADISAIIRLSRLPFHIAQREKKTLLAKQINAIQIIEDEAFSPGNAVTLWQGYKGASALGERGKSAEKVAEEVVETFRQENAEIDYHLADQLLIYAALARGESSYQTSQISQHLQTNLYVLNQFITRKMWVEENRIVVQH